MAGDEIDVGEGDVDEEGHVVAPLPDEQRVLHRAGVGTQDADRLVADLPPVAVRAVQEIAAPLLPDTLDVRQLVAVASGDQDSARIQRSAHVEDHREEDENRRLEEIGHDADTNEPRRSVCAPDPPLRRGHVLVGVSAREMVEVRMPKRRAKAALQTSIRAEPVTPIATGTTRTRAGSGMKPTIASGNIACAPADHDVPQPDDRPNEPDDREQRHDHGD
jgi:hypothetical protein